MVRIKQESNDVGYSRHEKDQYNVNLGGEKQTELLSKKYLRSGTYFCSPAPPSYYSVIQPQTTTASRVAQNSSRRASSPAGERSITSASSGVRRVPGVPAGRISSVARCTASPGQSRRARRSTTRSASGSPWRSAASTNDARALTTVHASVWGPLRARKTMSNEERRGLARTSRAPHARRESSPGEGTMRRVRVRSWLSGRMEREKVSCDGQDGMINKRVHGREHRATGFHLPL